MARILIADDHPIFRQGVLAILSKTTDLVVAAEAGTCQQVLEKVRSGRFDAVILDLKMPGRGGLETLKLLRSEYPGLPVLVMSMYPEDQYATRVLRAGAAGYLTKEQASEELVGALRKILGGGKYVTSSLAEALAFGLEKDIDSPLHTLLSDREYQVMAMIAGGGSLKEIAADLHLSEKTISTYRARILEKMNLKSNAEITRYALENDLIG